MKSNQMGDANMKFVVVVTYGRSGSTALQGVLQTIPGYHITGENYNCLSALYHSVRLATVARFEHGKNDHASIDPWFGADKIDPERYGAKLARVFTEEIIQPPAGTRVAGFKEIRFHEVGEAHFEDFLNFIHQHFTSCKFVFNTRGWRELVRSGWWKNQRPERVEEIIRSADAMYSEYLERYPGQGILLRHEETRSNPMAFKPLFDFLEEPFDKEIVSAAASRRLGHSGE